ncbi:MAG: glycosyltransferase [Planctomycetota bacterium]|nr:glycosyltransferase [Planctomycetota bacterium]
MRTLILTDAIFATLERAMLARVEIGLADEGVAVVHAAPSAVGDRARDLAESSVFARFLMYDSSPVPWTKGLTASRLLEAAREQGDDAFDVVHVFGGGAWDLGRRVAAMTNAGLVLEVWRSGLVPRARALRGPSGRVALHTPDPAIAKLLVGSLNPARVVRWGVHAEPVPPRRSRDHAPCAIMIGSGHDVLGIRSLLRGYALVLSKHPELRVFADATLFRRSRSWRDARALKLLPSLSLVDELETRRDLIMQADLLLVPESLGEHRSVVLEAMSCGQLVIAQRDPAASDLLDRVTCLVIPSPAPEAWEAAIAAALRDQDLAQRIARGGYEHVRQHHRVSDQIAETLETYAKLTQPSLAFPRAAPRPPV